MTLIAVVHSNVIPNFQQGAPTIPKNGPIRYNTQDITTSTNKML